MVAVPHALLIALAFIQFVQGKPLSFHSHERLTYTEPVVPDATPIESYLYASNHLPGPLKNVLSDFYRTLLYTFGSLHPAALLQRQSAVTLLERALTGEEASSARAKYFENVSIDNSGTEVLNFPSWGQAIVLEPAVDHLGIDRISCASSNDLLRCKGGQCLRRRFARIFRFVESDLHRIMIKAGMLIGWTSHGMPPLHAVFTRFCLGFVRLLKMNSNKGSQGPCVGFCCGNVDATGLRNIVNCTEALDISEGAARSLREDLGQVAAAAVYTSLKHHHRDPADSKSAVAPQIPERVTFHWNLGRHRTEILRWLLLFGGEGSEESRETVYAVELGVFLAETSITLLEKNHHLVLWGIDPYLERMPDDRGRGTWQNVYDVDTFEAVKLKLSRFGSRSRLWRQTSAEAARNFNVTLDLVFIDADHSYDAVREDIGIWEPHVRPGGVVSGHDYHTHGVSLAVHEHVIAINVPLHLGPDFMWWYHVPDHARAL